METLKELGKKNDIDFSAEEIEYIENKIKVIPENLLFKVFEQIISNYSRIREHFKLRDNHTIEDIAKFQMKLYLENISKILIDKNTVECSEDLSWTVRLF